MEQNVAFPAGGEMNLLDFEQHAKTIVDQKSGLREGEPADAAKGSRVSHVRWWRGHPFVRATFFGADKLLHTTA